MQKFEIDYSEISTPAGETPESDWEPPVHKYFGKKLPNGKTEKEPLYSYKEYPRMMYALRAGKIVARQVNSDQERDALGPNWETTFAAFGHISAPSFEQKVAMDLAAQAKDQPKQPEEAESVFADAVTAEAPRRGRPPKAE